MTVVFLDFDGVLNDHTRFPNGWSGLDRRKVAILNDLLKRVPEARVVVSSAWRYTFGSAKLCEAVLMVHGANVEGKVHGITETDEETEGGAMPSIHDVEAWRAKGLKWRGKQILKYVEEHGVTDYVVLDDLPVDCPNLVQTDPAVGLTRPDLKRAIATLRRAFRLVGNDNDFIHIVCRSWSKPEAEHNLAVSRRSGEITCTCEDASCRKKVGDILNPALKGCKHINALHAEFSRLVAEGGV